MSTRTRTEPNSSTLSFKGMLIGGQWVESASGAGIVVENPANRAPIAEVPRGNAADVERAVAAARKAYADWRKVAPRERGKVLLKIAEAVQLRGRLSRRGSRRSASCASLACAPAYRSVRCKAFRRCGSAS